MLRTPYRIGPASGVAPGALIEHERGPFVVDEVRRTADGLTILGRPRHRVLGRRVAIDRKPDEEVVFLPDSGEIRELLRQTLVAAVEAGVRSHHRDPDSEVTPPYGVEEERRVVHGPA